MATRVWRFAEAERARLDQFLTEREPELSRAQVKRLVESGDVLVNGVPAKVGYRLRPGDEVELTLRPAAPVELTPEDIPLRVVYEDRHLIVVDKPAGLVVHPAAGHASGTLVNALLFHCRDLAGIGGELRPGIVHRLDKDTSGLMVATKDDATHTALVDMFKARELLREYIAIVAPPPRAREGSFETLYGRHPTHRKKFSSKVRRGKTALTTYREVRRFGDRAAMVRCRLGTGRTHQIRVHFADAGSPVIGDPLYARRASPHIGRQALHAALFEFVHPATGERLHFESELPADMAALVAHLAAESFES